MESPKSNFKIIIQARMGSTRLPGKMLLNIGGEKLIDIIIKRLLKVFSEKNIVLATSKNKENIPLVDVVKAYNIEIYSGSENNVLSRFVEIANIHKVKYIVRITGDSPFVDANIINKGLLQIEKNNLDYVSTTLDNSYPVGIHVEIFKSKLIENLDPESSTEISKEHVTPFIYNNKSLKCSLIKYKISYPPGRYTVDYDKDIEFFRKIEDKSGLRLSEMSPKNIQDLYESNNSIFLINNMLQKERTVRE